METYHESDPHFEERLFFNWLLPQLQTIYSIMPRAAWYCSMGSAVAKILELINALSQRIHTLNQAF